MARQNTEYTVKAIFRDRATLTWQSEILQDRGTIEKYADTEGFSYAVEVKLAEDYEHFLGKKPSERLRLLLKYIAWKSRGGGKHVFLAWDRHAEIYREVTGFLNLTASIVSTSDHKIGENLGKFEAPGSSITIKPPDFRQLMQWAVKERRENYLESFLSQMALGLNGVNRLLEEREREGYLSASGLEELWGGDQLVEWAANWRGATALIKLRLGIGSCCVEWNRQFFTRGDCEV